MRVIAGEYRRRLLQAPKGMATRPTSDRLRETLFNVLAPRIEGARFLDLYAGSGANGIEALSRGARSVTFVEQAPQAVAAIRANLAALGVPRGAYAVEARAVAAFLRASARHEASLFEIVFLDPPYDLAEEYEAALGLLGRGLGSVLASTGVVVAEHRRARRGEAVDVPGQQYGMLTRMRVLEQGEAALSFYEVRPPDGHLDGDPE